MTDDATELAVSLFHWNEEELAERVTRLEEAGLRVVQRVWDAGGGFAGELNEREPDAAVIDLGRLPSHGREVARYLRRTRVSRHLPLVFVDGAAGKVEPIRELLPDAVYADWEAIGGAVRRAVSEAPEDPVVPPDRYEQANRSLAAKLNVGEGTTLALLDAPADFEATLGRLPDGATTTRDRSERSDLTLWFVRDQAALRNGMDDVALRANAGGIWIAWPKKASEMESDLSQDVVQETALERGLVDHKICAIDETWSGMLFSPRRD